MPCVQSANLLHVMYKGKPTCLVLLTSMCDNHTQSSCIKQTLPKSQPPVARQLDTTLVCRMHATLQPFCADFLPMYSLSQAAVTWLQTSVQTAVSPQAPQCCHARQLLQAAGHCLLLGICAARALHAVAVLWSTSSAWRRRPGEPHTRLSRRRLCSVCGRRQSARTA